MSQNPEPRLARDINKHWQSLAERRRLYLLEMQRSGRWRRYYSDDEMQAQMREVVRKVDEGYDEATNEDELPRRYHEAQMHYFGELKKLTEATEAEAADESDG